ncbi:SGNH/GDSL hydrolase family protein [Rhizobium sp. LjRoot254]|uniref:SGNH/GDSL hydrolase family protein n=1 Tax=Rhizobium sp. LjRoot254 TaxID=3342297 RepID=UPI003ECC9C19
MMLIVTRSRLAGLITKCLLPLLAAAFLILDPAFNYTNVAQAQETRERRSIIDMIFRPNRRKKVTNANTSVIRVKRPRRKKSKTTSDPAVTGAEIEIAKLPDAKKVMVIGDFMGSALADGLEVAFAPDAGIVIDKRTDGSSGLVRTDHLDWPQTLTTYIGEVKPAMIVIMLGANDRQQMSINGKKEKYQTEAWNAEYEKRIAAIIEIAKQNKTPFLWVGLPAFSSPSLSADAAILNNLYRVKSEMAGGEFIDIWDGFADENGKFIASGSDMNGQPVRLRGSDGLSFTKAGKRKVAFYVEKSIRKLIGVGVPAISQLNPAGTIDSAATSPTITNIVAVPPISLVDPELDGSSRLLDQASVPKASGITPRDKLIEKGETIDAPEGRVDDFKWKPVAKPAG